MSLAIFDFINYTFFDKYCITCNKTGSYICSKCILNNYKVNFRNICHVCGRSSYKYCTHKECEDLSNIDNLYFFCEYNAAAKELIDYIKYKGNYAIIDDVALHMASYLKTTFPVYKDFTFTFVPSHWTKQNIRGFNQSKLLAQKIADNLGIDLVEYLKKTKPTSKQAGTNKSQRSKNLQGKFACTGTLVSRNVMIIDDVHTTGATLNECAAILKKNGASLVYGYTFSKSMNYSANEIK